MKFNLLLVFIIAFYANSLAQSTKDLHPIEVKNSLISTKYFYGDQSFESPYGLQIPLMQVKDSFVTKNFNVFRRSRNTAKIINLISAGFSLYAFFDREAILRSSYWITLGSLGVASGFFNIRSSIYVDKAVGRYNKIVSGNEFGFHYDKTDIGNGIISIGISHRF
ncbi:hypothetical protein [Catalinimonas niigatensis]|uniref:hypothetical protein n=1 Tax=Catalinimonas niigatensis TaxID=1397264 RepID=UPI002666BEF4|nr:hypothetical protein [Catalinimonas niigatensis]WPP48706.1 hypothetical protein PZB72_18730 [Catalinimonas niigatensis]